MLWIRGLIFTLLVPFVVGVVVPYGILHGNHTVNVRWMIGWWPVVCGAIVYALCLLSFLASGGTPMIFFARHLKFLTGEEPPKLVKDGLYRVSRNPMYLGVLLVLFGQAILFASRDVAFYGLAAWLTFHLVVILLEEPHLRKERGPSYDDYCRRVPRWLGVPR